GKQRQAQSFGRLFLSELTNRSFRALHDASVGYSEAPAQSSVREWAYGGMVQVPEGAPRSIGGQSSGQAEPKLNHGV
ncbi:MAG TPA: hypothetical protein VN113_02850, partial [Caulobacter sp.]|nr:hypothetical protein [Caulobacter sp.]